MKVKKESTIVGKQREDDTQGDLHEETPRPTRDGDRKVGRGNNELERRDNRKHVTVVWFRRQRRDVGRTIKKALGVY